MVSVLDYSVVCILSILAGVSVLRLLRISLDQPYAIFLAPPLSLSLCLVLLAAGLALGLPMRSTAPLLIVVIVLAAAAGLCFIRPIWNGRIWLCAALPLVTYWQAFMVGLNDFKVSGGVDSFLYVMCAHTYWRYVPASLNDSLGPMYQIARSQMHLWRYGASSLLALLSYLYVPGDSQQSLGLMVAFIFFVLGCSVFVLARAFGAPEAAPWRDAATVVVVVLSGWIANIVLQSNLDQLVCLPLGLLVTALARDPPQGVVRVALPVLLGMVTAYPEYFILFVLQVAVIYLSAHRLPRPRLAWLVMAVPCAWCLLQPVALLRLRTVVSPASTWRFGTHTFSALLRWDSMCAAFWGTGAEWGPRHSWWGQSPLALMLSVWLLAAAWDAHRRKGRILLALLVPGLGMCYALLICSYPYMAYKFLIVGWPFVCLLLVDQLALTRRLAARCIGGLLLVAMVAIGQLPSNRAEAALNDLLEPFWPPYRALQTALPPGDRHAVLVCVDDYAANMNAIYYLRDRAVVVGIPTEFEASFFVRNLIDFCGSRFVKDIEYVLVRRGEPAYQTVQRVVSGPAVFRSSRYDLFRLQPDWKALPLQDPPPILFANAFFKVYNRDAAALDVSGKVEGGSEELPLTVVVNGATGPSLEAKGGAFHGRVALVPRLNEITIAPMGPTTARIEVTDVR